MRRKINTPEQMIKLTILKHDNRSRRSTNEDFPAIFEAYFIISMLLKPMDQIVVLFSVDSFGLLSTAILLFTHFRKIPYNYPSRV